MWKKQGEVDHEDDPGIHGVGQFVLMKLYISLLINSKSACIVIVHEDDLVKHGGTIYMMMS